jgi:beta-lactamase superfamily II metal-dependent hydrolase
LGIEIDVLKVGEGTKSGEAVTLRMGNLRGDRAEQLVVLIDGGFPGDGRKIVRHISKNYSTDKVDLVVVTHPDRGHTGGIMAVLEEMSVGEVWMHLPWRHSIELGDLFAEGTVAGPNLDQEAKETYRDLHRIFEFCNDKEHRIPMTEPFSDGSPNGLAKWGVTVLGPTKAFYESLLPGFQGAPNSKRRKPPFSGLRRYFKRFVADDGWTENLEDPADGETSQENNSGVILSVVCDGQLHLFTADAGKEGLTAAIDQLKSRPFGQLPLRVFKVPNHGSRHNIGPTILDAIIGPTAASFTRSEVCAVISATEKDLEHPSGAVTNAINRRGARAFVTSAITTYFQKDAPRRSGVHSAVELPLYAEVDAN